MLSTGKSTSPIRRLKAWEWMRSPRCNFRTTAFHWQAEENVFKKEMEKVKKRIRRVQNHGSKVIKKLHESELSGLLQNFSAQVWTPQFVTLSPSPGFGYISPVFSLTAPWPAESRAWKLRTEHFIRIFNKFSVKRLLVTHWENYYNKVWW